MDMVFMNMMVLLLACAYCSNVSYKTRRRSKAFASPASCIHSLLSLIHRRPACLAGCHTWLIITYPHPQVKWNFFTEQLHICENTVFQRLNKSFHLLPAGLIFRINFILLSMYAINKGKEPDEIGYRLRNFFQYPSLF